MQEQLLEREDVIISKEETCKAARDEQINLENFRYLLDQKIKTLTSEKGVILDRIGEQERILKDTFQELIRESNKNDGKNEEIRKQENQIKVMSSELKKQDLEILLLRHKLHEMNNNIGKILQNKSKDKWGGLLNDMVERSKRNDGSKTKI